MTMNRWLSVIWSTPRYRSLAGIALGLVILATLLGILACLETPVGDPERASVDPRLTGIWLSGNPRPSENSAMIWIFEPYDARTWLLTAVELGHNPGGTSGTAAPSPVSVDVLHILASLREHPPYTPSVSLFKAWLAELGGQRFLVLESKAEPTRAREFLPQYWWLFRVRLEGSRMLLDSVHISTEDLSNTTSRKHAEQIIARHATDAKFYDNRVDTLFPVPHAGYDDVRQILEKGRLH